jgi:hypothetical protein
MMLGQYNHPISLCVGLCVVLAAASGYAWIGSCHSAIRWTAFMIVSALAYYAAAGLYVVMAVLCAIVEWRVHRHRPLAVWCALSAVLVPVGVGTLLCDLSILDAYRGILLPPARYWLAVPSSASVSLAIRAALLLSVPLAALAVGGHRRSAPSPLDNPGEAHCNPKRERGRVDESTPHSLALRVMVTPAHSLALRALVLPITMIVLATSADLALFDAPTKHSLLVAYHGERQDWAVVLTHARRLPPSDVWNVFHVNRALYHRGELLERMFAYPQVVDPAPTLTLRFENLTDTAQRVPLESSDILFELGRINESEHMAYEALELFGERPHTLQRLVQLHVIKGEPDAARRFLAVLERSPWHRRGAHDFLRQLDADPTLADVPAIASRRGLMVVRDVAGEMSLEMMLVQLLERNPRNRMAFEYLMAHYLLTKRLDRLVANLHRFDDFDGDVQPRSAAATEVGRALLPVAGNRTGKSARPTLIAHDATKTQVRFLPRHCEEALVIFLEGTGSPASNLDGRTIRPETWQRNRAFVQSLGRFPGNLPAAFTALHHDFGDSYFFFYVFGHNDLRFVPARPSE